MPVNHVDHWVHNETTGQMEKKSKSLKERLKNRKQHGEVEYMTFRSWLDQCYIHHAGQGQQICVGVQQYRCDGFSRWTGGLPKVYNYNGKFLNMCK